MYVLVIIEHSHLTTGFTREKLISILPSSETHDLPPYHCVCTSYETMRHHCVVCDKW